MHERVIFDSVTLILQHKSLEELPSAASNWKLLSYSRQVSILASLREEETVTIYPKQLYAHILQSVVSSPFSLYQKKIKKLAKKPNPDHEIKRSSVTASSIQINL